MNFDKYQIESDKKKILFEFTSVGIKGEISKIVQYTETSIDNYFNLGFGDKDAKTGAIDDTVITNNGDSIKVLATVASTVYTFIEKYPKALIFIKGSNKVRTRLYRIGISNNLQELEKDFEVFGYKGGFWDKFFKNTEYESFLIRKKL